MNYQNIGQIEDENKRLKLENEILKTGVHGELKSDLFTSTLNGLILQGATLSDAGKLIYLDVEGKPLIDSAGEQYTIQSRINEIKQDKDNSTLIFQSRALDYIEPKKGVLEEHKTVSRANLNFKEKEEIINTHGRDYYESLPLVVGM